MISSNPILSPHRKLDMHGSFHESYGAFSIAIEIQAKDPKQTIPSEGPQTKVGNQCYEQILVRVTLVEIHAHVGIFTRHRNIMKLHFHEFHILSNQSSSTCTRPPMAGKWQSEPDCVSQGPIGIESYKCKPMLRKNVKFQRESILNNQF